MLNATYDIVDYKPKPATNPYDEAVESLIAAGDGAALKLEVEPGKARYQRLVFQRAANARGYTARVVESGEHPDCDFLVFVLKKREKRGKLTDETTTD